MASADEPVDHAEDRAVVVKGSVWPG